MSDSLVHGDMQNLIDFWTDYQQDRRSRSDELETAIDLTLVRLKNLSRYEDALVEYSDRALALEEKLSSYEKFMDSFEDWLLRDGRKHWHKKMLEGE